MKKQAIDVAAYVWPAYTGDEPRSRIFWPEGMGEWQTVRDAKPKFPGHEEPRRCLWGYCNEASADVMEMQINAAVRHGVNVFIYDWYWYDGRPFLEQCLKGGFLGAPNNEQMRFYLMYANHDVNHLWDKRNSHDLDGAVIWRGAVSAAEFDAICRHVIEKYFKLPNYYTIDGKPVFMVYDLKNLAEGLGGIDAAAQALARFDLLCRQAGLAGVHLQLALWGAPFARDAAGNMLSCTETARRVGFHSLTSYQFCHMTDINRPYSALLPDVMDYWAQQAEQFGVYVPHVSVGWDNNARFYGFNSERITDNTPAQFARAMAAARDFCRARPKQPQLITVNSWNEWTEGSYLQPDTRYGYGYLDAIRSTVLG